eukprot:5513697-Pyramimonas_sp.AAC.1
MVSQPTQRKLILVAIGLLALYNLFIAQQLPRKVTGPGSRLRWAFDRVLTPYLHEYAPERELPA